MKKMYLQGSILGIIAVSFFSCGSQDDSLNINTESNQKVNKNSSLSCEDLLDAPEDFEGKTITLDAISWGSSPSVDGKEILMSIDDNKLAGLQQSHVLVHFTKEQANEIEDIKENDPVKLTATVGAYEYGALRLVNAKISPKKK